MKSENDETVTQRVTAPVEDVPAGSARYGSRSGSSLSQVHVDTGKLSRRGLRHALIFIALGLLSFALPTIVFEPPLQGQKYFSVLDICQRPEVETTKNSSGSLFDFQAVFALIDGDSVRVGVCLLRNARSRRGRNLGFSLSQVAGWNQPDSGSAFSSSHFEAQSVCRACYKACGEGELAGPHNTSLLVITSSVGIVSTAYY